MRDVLRPPAPHRGGAAVTYRMIYLTRHRPNRPQSIPVAAASAAEATRVAETVARLCSWYLLTVTNRR